MSATECASDPAPTAALCTPARRPRRQSGRVLDACAGAAIALAVASLQPPSFTATAAFAWRGKPLQPGAHALETLLVGLDGRSLGRHVVERLDLERAWALAPGWQAEARLARRVRIVTDGAEGSFRIEVRDSDAARAAAIADACVEELRATLAHAGPTAPEGTAMRGVVDAQRAAEVPTQADARHVWGWVLGGAMTGLVASALGSSARSPRSRRNLR